ncbi:hypothetical protein K6119_10875 [Paracrocinitomix mangrovi]|uniref:hypothetical protein n=1 Tax=Paracrocinitomix mangrovi TaxID=2862509 RepID=UPI001C8EC0CA|nr:hypothetical protein [Paracrocinitomix mangrovi]UKN00236.1 hypothetical protein K6119_10875 [Paracrocinitomix mangrovi]
MKKSKYHHLVFGISLLLFTALFSCRKKEVRYEGTYVGTERIFQMDSGVIIFDSSYNQMVTVEYSKKKYTIKRIFNNSTNFEYIDPHNSFMDGSAGFGDCADDGQGNLSCLSSWRHFYDADSMRIDDGSSSGNLSTQLIFLGKRLEE